MKHLLSLLKIQMILGIILIPNNVVSMVLPDDTTWFVRSGKAVDVQDLNNSWKADSNLTALGTENLLAAGRTIGMGDFDVFATIKLKDLTMNNASLMLDASGQVETGEFIFSRTNNIVVRGFFFGDRTQKVRPVDDILDSNKWFNLKIIRRRDTVSFYLNEELIWRMRYENIRPFGKITLKPGDTKMSIKDFGVIGETYPLDDWVPLTERDYTISGNGAVNVFIRGENGYHTYRIPAMVITNHGTLLAFAEGRKRSAADHGDVDLVLRRSNDLGQTWEPIQLVYEEGSDEYITIGNPVPVVDRQNGRIWLFFCRDNKNVLVTFSDDEGLTWRPPIDLTTSLKKEEWSDWYATGPCHGIQLLNGKLIIPANHGVKDGGSMTHMIMSDNHGKSWYIGGIPQSSGNENSIAELDSNVVYVNMRISNHNNKMPYCRKVTYSSDGGLSFNKVKYDYELIGPVCEASVLKVKSDDGSNILLFSNPASQRREKMTVKASLDNGKSWSNGILIYGGSSAYSDLVRLNKNEIGLLFERDWYNAITYVRFNIEDTFSN